MNPTQTQQPNNSQMDPNQVLVGLASTNNFLQGHLQSQLPPPQDPAQGEPQNQTTPDDTKNQIEGLESRLMDELSTLRAEMKTQGDGKQELADLKKQIEQILQSND